MDVAALMSKVTFQKNETVTNKYGNHKNDWADYYTCFATIGGEGLASSKEEQAAGDHRALGTECADAGGE